MRTTTRRSFLALSTTMAAMLAACGAQQDNASASNASTSSSASSATQNTSTQRQTIEDNSDGGHAIEVSKDTANYTAVDVIKTGNAEGDEADFYGVNSAVYAEEGATLDLDDITVNTNGTHANAVFSYGTGTTVRVKNSSIDTSANCSGGIMVTGGGTLEATDLTVHTLGRSSAAIRSDRGGGVQNVTGGNFTTEGVGSPAIYSTAEVHVKNAQLTSTTSQGVVVEGKNSVELVDCTLSANNNAHNSDKSSWFQAVMIYQSMSGDAAQGEASFTMTGGSLTNVSGDVFFVNNTVANINLSGASIVNNDQGGMFLRAAAAGWGSEGSNGGQVTLTARGQEIAGNMLVDEVSHLNLHLEDGSSLVGAINADGASGAVHVSLPEGCTWELTADSYITSLTCGTAAISLRGYTLMVAGTAYEEGTASSGEDIAVVVSESHGGPGGDTPPEPPDGAGNGAGDGTPPEAPAGGEPPAKPNGE